MAKILIVEDSEMNLDMLSRRLARRGFEIVAAKDGAEGVERAKAELPDLVLMDMSLPVMDGYQATRILKSSPETRAIPILGLSAHAMTGDARKALDAGCDGYDTKPVDLRRLLGKIEGLLEQADARRDEGGEAGLVPEPPGASPVAHGRALIIASKGTEALRLQRLLGGLGLAAALLRSGDDLGDLLARGTYEVVLLDGRDSELGAERLLSRLREVAGDGMPPVVAIAMDLRSAFQLIRLGARAYLPASFTEKLFVERVGSVLSR